LAELKLYFQVVDPENPDELLVDETWIKYRHATSGYEEECRFINKTARLSPIFSNLHWRNQVFAKTWFLD
jgi:hypothetical protein